MESSPPAARISLVIGNVVWVGILAHAGFIPLFLWLGHPRLALFNVASVSAWSLAAVLNSRGACTAAMWLIFAEVTGHAVAATATLGWGSGFQNYLVPLIPFVMFNDRVGSLTVVAASAGVFLADAALRVLAPVLALDPRVERLLIVSNIAIPLTALALLTYFFRLASIRAERRMEQMALTDPLTGLFNRRHMHGRLQEAQAQFSRDRRPFCILLADIDHFKRINDEHGHDAGDRVLQAVAALFGEELRGRDVVARWGGEEFLMLLPEIEAGEAREVAERLRGAAENRIAGLAGLGRSVTVSLGLSAYTAEAPIERLLKSADEALYAGKAAGRNRVIVAAAASGEAVG